MQQETILFASAANKFCLLNASAAAVWGALETPSDAEAIAVMLCETFDGVTAEQARRDVEAALTELQALALVEVAQ